MVRTETPRPILKRNRNTLIRVVASADEGTRGNAEELRVSMRRPVNKLARAKDSFQFIKANGTTTCANENDTSVHVSNAQEYREIDMPSSDTNPPSDDANPSNGNNGHEGADNHAGDRDNDDDRPHGIVEMVQISPTTSSADSLLDIIINEHHDLLAVEDALNTLYLRLKKVFLLGQATPVSENTGLGDDQPSIVKAIEARTSDIYRALLRDIKRLVQPAPTDTTRPTSYSPRSGPSTPTRNQMSSPAKESEETPRPRRQGYTESEVRNRRAAAGVGQGALKTLSIIGHVQQLYELFSSSEMTSMLAATMIIPATPRLHTPNSKRTYLCAIHVLSTLRAPASVTAPIKDKICRALTNAVGDVCAKYWGGATPTKGNETSGGGPNLKAKIEGYGAIWNLCTIHHEVMAEFHPELIPEVLKGIVHTNSSVRTRASAALGALANSKLTWIRQTQRALEKVVQEGKLENEEDDAMLKTRLDAAQKAFFKAVKAGSQSAKVVNNCLKQSSRPSVTSGRQQLWDEVQSRLKCSLMNDPHWTCATWSCLVTLLGTHFSDTHPRYESMQSIILGPIRCATPPSPGRTWLSRFAFDHNIHAIVNHGKDFVLGENDGLPGIIYNFDHSLSSGALEDAMQLVSEAWDREVALQQQGKQPLTRPSKSNNEIMVLEREVDHHVMYLRACAATLCVITYAYSTAILKGIHSKSPRATSTAGSEPKQDAFNLLTPREKQHARLDQLWDAINPYIGHMVDTKWIDWIKVEGWTLLASIVGGPNVEVDTQVAKENTRSHQGLDAILHPLYLQGEAVTTDVTSNTRETSLNAIVNAMFDTEIQADQVPAFPAQWITGKIVGSLIPLFKRAFRAMSSITDDVEWLRTLWHDQTMQMRLPVSF